MNEDVKKTIKDSLEKALKEIDTHSVEDLESKEILKKGMIDQINQILINIDIEPEEPIFTDDTIPTLWNPIIDVLKQVRIAYLDHNVISKFANDDAFIEQRNKLLEMKKNGWIFVYSQTHIEETSLINPSNKLKDKSKTDKISKIIFFIKELCGNFLIDPLTKTIQTRSPIELFNTINEPISVDLANNMVKNASQLITKKHVESFRNLFKSQPKYLNNCKDFTEATEHINELIVLHGSAITQNTEIKNLNDWILYNIDYAKKHNLITHSNDDYSYFTEKALMFEFFGYQAQSSFNFKTGLLADGTHGYISTLVNLFICDDNKLVKSLRYNSGKGCNDTEILTIPEFTTKY